MILEMNDGPPVPGPNMRTAGSERTPAYRDEQQHAGRARPTHTYRGARRAIARQTARRMGTSLKEIWEMLKS